MEALKKTRVRYLSLNICTLIVHLLVAAAGIVALTSRESQTWQIVFVVIFPIVDMATIIILLHDPLTAWVVTHPFISTCVFAALELTSQIPLLLAIIKEFQD